MSEAEARRRLALFAGSPTLNGPLPEWPQHGSEERENVLRVLESGRWERHDGSLVDEFERRFAAACRVDRCLMVTSGSTALEIALSVAGVGAGDEVLVPPYTFMSTIMSVLMVGALPIFVDIDPDTYCMNPARMEERIGAHTRAVVPVHLGGLPCDMERVLEVGQQYGLSIIEDACQAHLAEWKGRKVGGIGQLGCFSFQVSKNISCGEGGAITSNDPDLLDRCYFLHTCGRLRAGAWYYHPHPGSNRRMTEFQAALLLAQLDRAPQQMTRRSENAAHLSSRLAEVDGIEPLCVPAYVTLHAYHLYIFRYDEQAFDGLHRDLFVEALAAEGIPCVKGYVPLYQEEFIWKTIQMRKLERVFGAERLAQYKGHLSDVGCPANERACREEAVWIPQSFLLASRQEMDGVVEAIEKIRCYATQLQRLRRS